MIETTQKRIALLVRVRNELRGRLMGGRERQRVESIMVDIGALMRELEAEIMVLEMENAAIDLNRKIWYVTVDDVAEVYENETGAMWSDLTEDKQESVIERAIKAIDYAVDGRWADGVVEALAEEGLLSDDDDDEPYHLQR